MATDLSVGPRAVALTAAVASDSASIALWLVKGGGADMRWESVETMLTFQDERDGPNPGVPLERIAALVGDPAYLSIWFHFEDGSEAYINPSPGGAELQITLPTNASQDVSARVFELAKILEGLRAAFRVEQARTSWLGGGALCLPTLPIVGSRTQVVLTDEAELREHYADIEVVRASFDEVREDGDQLLLLRALDTVTGRQFLESVTEGQWNMARAVNPGGTSYGGLEVTEDEEEVFFRGERTLHLAGYDSEHARLEFTCASDPGDHVQPFEIFELLHVIDYEETADGEPVRELRVIFLNQAAAEIEKPPLLDIGALVVYMNDDGEFMTLES